jgi:hypothetical protein
MPRFKSLLKSLAIDQAKRSHNCQSNHNHRIQKNDHRLCVKEGRKTSCYCVECARMFLENARIEVDNLINELGG